MEIIKKLNTRKYRNSKIKLYKKDCKEKEKVREYDKEKKEDY
jgi:hypothetical protein